MMLLSAQFVVYMAHLRVDLVASSRAAATRLSLGHEFPLAAFVLPIAGGALIGALLGYATRRLVRVLPRLVFFCFSLPVLWVFVRALVIQRYAPWLAGTLPFGPLAVGAFVYATFLAVVAPIRSS
jgi:ABC-type dipeptide/oligopeptide/nickel transport system permease subunit